MLERATENQNAGNIEKIIHIETCRNCKDHRQSTWHDETKYETNFNLGLFTYPNLVITITLVKEAIEELVPGVEVLKNTDEARILGGFEIMHKEKVNKNPDKY